MPKLVGLLLAAAASAAAEPAPAAADAAPSTPEWATILFNNSSKREKASRGVTKWRQSKATHVDMLVGNYLSNYFQDLAEAIRKGAPKFKRPRRTDGMRFYDSCLPGGINFKTATIPKVRPAGRWDWFVYENATARFWESMQPLVEHTLDHAFDKCGIHATVSAPVLHFRCASAPLNRHSQYHFQRYSFYKAAARRYRRRFKAPLRQLHLLTCVADDFSNPEQTSVCTSYLEDLIRFLQTELQIEVFVSNCAHSMFEDLAIMYYAPFLISTGSTMSLLPGVARHVVRHTFAYARFGALHGAQHACAHYDALSPHRFVTPSSLRGSMTRNRSRSTRARAAGGWAAARAPTGWSKRTTRSATARSPTMHTPHGCSRSCAHPPPRRRHPSCLRSGCPARRAFRRRPRGSAPNARQSSAPSSARWPASSPHLPRTQ